ncbi:MAG: NADH-quinone oxidoreductase subunit N, partial [Acidobacteriales bacterium]|nr:NADH-quinone oxidoreductase subunit N [Terriglobales bacterium]
MNTAAHLESIRILPEIVLSVFGIIVMLADPFLKPRASRRPLGYVSLAGILLALFTTALQMRPEAAGNGYYNMVRVDAFSIFFHFVILSISLLVTVASFDYLDQQEIRVGEYYALILFGTVGMTLMSSATELVMIFIALEISSIATYILAGFRKRYASSTESAIKYFLLGSFATAFFLYGVALMFGATGSTNVDQISATLTTGSGGILSYLAVAMMIVGIGFKVSASPFHIWTPDGYEGSPAPIVGLMSTGPKAAAFAVLLRVLFGASAPGWFWIIWISAALSMTIGNLGALLQNNVKRLLAYSSIAHAGYILVAFAAGTRDGISAAIFYAASYAAMNVGAFLVVSYFARQNEQYVSIDDYRGLGTRSPILAATLTIFLLSLIGIPLTGGFYAKFQVFRAAIGSGLIGLTVIGLMNSAIAAYYYLRLIVVMYMYPTHESSETHRHSAAPRL